MGRRIECRTGEIAYSYKQYLKTAHWKMVREKCIEDCGGVCLSCKSTDKPLEIHHRHYDTIGNEQNADLRPLCRDCHEREHEDPEPHDHIMDMVKSNASKAKPMKITKSTKFVQNDDGTFSVEAPKRKATKLRERKINTKRIDALLKSGNLSSD